MSEVANSGTTAKKSGATKALKKPRSAPNHPKVSEMVNAAISDLKERGGSSLQAIKKYIGSNYSVDVERIAPFIRKYLKTAVTNGTLIQTKGKGASGSFKLGNVNKKSEKETVPKKPKTEKKVVKSPTKSKEIKKVTKKPKLVASPSKASVASKKSVKTPKPSKKASKEKVKKTPTKAKTPKPKKASAKSPKSTAPKQDSSGSAQD